ncbi:MAG: M23 family metallopeptidase [Patescibacteria group bacterium]|nr:M23 family metallopeptidase [Patescibacteria group bacterium]
MKYFWSIAPPILAILTLGLIVLAGCSGEEGLETTFKPEVQVDSVFSPQPQAAGAWLSVAWPLGQENPNHWTGWQEPRTKGAPGSFCGGTRSWTHSGADYMARDLAKAGCSGKNVYAGINGRVVQAISPGEWNHGYGGTVVVYDHNRRVALRFSHLSEVAVSYNQSVTFRTRIGKVGNTGYSTGPHLHLAAYENIDHFSGGDPVIPILCDSDWYTCGTYFYCWQ